jgi:5'-3' exonuclease
MGIPHYFHTITQTHKGILHFSKPVPCQHYFFDYNGAIHHSAQNVFKKMQDKDAPLVLESKEEIEQCILQHLWEYTRECVKTTTPSTTIGVYVDGVAPVAKISQQRKRRYLSILRNKILGTQSVWDTNAISPGTAFMTRMHAFVRHQIRESPDAVKYTFSGSNEPGEGEHKIFAHISTLPVGDNVFIHGLDADLIMLSLISHRRHMYLMREPSWPYTRESTEDGFLYLDIDELRKGILLHLAQHFRWEIPVEVLSDSYCEDAQRIIETYVVLCFLLGNDFLPHGPTLTLKGHGYEKIFHAAKDAFALYPHGCVLTEEKQLFLPFLAHVLNDISKDENERLWKANEDYMKRKPSMQADVADAYPLQPQHKDPLASAIYSSGQPSKWRSLYYKHLFFARTHDTRIIAQACKEYITGLCWTYAYYKRLPKPFDWYYPYGYPPTLLDISNYLQGTMHEWDQLQTEWKEKHKRPTWLEPGVQLLCILPKESAELLPPKFREFMFESSKGLTYMYPCEYPIQTYMHVHLWECAPVLPTLDVAWIRQCTGTDTPI